MKNILLIIFLSVVSTACCSDEGNNKTKNDSIILKKEFVEVVIFPSLDSLIITARVYEISQDAPVIVLCHQARFNKFEYAGIAEELNKLGFNCIAIDQRSGGPMGDQVNETTIRALGESKSIDYIDAEPDIIAAINYALGRYGRPVILWGSSYSSTLALYIAAENEDVKAVVSFSPGNYLSEYKGSLVDVMDGFNKPMFVTSSKGESEAVKELFKKMELADNQIVFVPVGMGHHGSRSLWKSQIGGEEYWAAIINFLNKL